jgi:hypothetical protein
MPSSNIQSPHLVQDDEKVPCFSKEPSIELVVVLPLIMAKRESVDQFFVLPESKVFGEGKASTILRDVIKCNDFSIKSVAVMYLYVCIYIQTHGKLYKFFYNSKVKLIDGGLTLIACSHGMVIKVISDQ